MFLERGLFDSTHIFPRKSLSQRSLLMKWFTRGKEEGLLMLSGPSSLESDEIFLTNKTCTTGQTHMTKKTSTSGLCDFLTCRNHEASAFDSLSDSQHNLHNSYLFSVTGNFGFFLCTWPDASEGLPWTNLCSQILGRSLS